jgi:hypothetical protein
VNLSPLLSSTMGNCLNCFLLSKIDVLWHFFWRALWISFIKRDLYEPLPLAKFNHRELVWLFSSLWNWSSLVYVFKLHAFHFVNKELFEPFLPCWTVDCSHYPHLYWTIMLNYIASVATFLGSLFNEDLPHSWFWIILVSNCIHQQYKQIYGVELLVSLCDFISCHDGGH